MLETIIGWLGGGLGTFIIGFASRFLTDWLSDKRADAAQRDAGRLQAERDNATATLDKQRKIDEVADRRDTEDDIIKRLDNGTG